jgi:CubicO group peptidase (beta-lactamase class C family)
MTKKARSFGFGSLLVFSLSCVLSFSGFDLQQDIQERGLSERAARSQPPTAYKASYHDPAPYDWPVSTPEAQGLDSAIFDNAFAEAAKLPNMYSLLVVRNGHLIGERYYNHQTMNDANHIHSASKSFTSALVGIAFRENYLHSLDQKMMDFFPEYAARITDTRKFDITLEHLLTMQAGFNWEDTEQNWSEYASSPNWVEYALSLPLMHDPGEMMHYSTVQTNLLSVILTRATGMSTKEFADLYLLGPLKISIRHWRQDPQGNYTGGHEMYYSPRNMARFGYLFLQKGKVDDLQIVPEEWVEASWQNAGQGNYDWIPLEDHGYGYQWWMGRLGGYVIFFASGKGGQNIIVIPELDMIVVTTTNADAWEGSWAQNQWVLRIVAFNILIPIRDHLGSPPYSPRGARALKVENRALLLKEYINVITWEDNPRNADENVVGYRIYRMFASTLFLLGEVDSRTFEYWDVGVLREHLLHYALTAVTDDGTESLPLYFSDTY